MKLEKETPGAVRYQELDDKGGVRGIPEGAILGTMYIRKSAFTKGVFPNTIQVEISSISGE